jgi:hypothetical protein
MEFGSICFPRETRVGLLFARLKLKKTLFVAARPGRFPDQTKPKMLLPSHPGSIELTGVLKAPPKKTSKKRKRKEAALSAYTPEPRRRDDKQRHWAITQITPEDAEPVRITMEMVAELMPEFKVLECHTCVDPLRNVHTHVYGKIRRSFKQMQTFADNTNAKYLHASSIEVLECKIRGKVLVAANVHPVKWLFSHYTAMANGKSHTFHGQVDPASTFCIGASKEHANQYMLPTARKPTKDITKAFMKQRIPELEEENARLKEENITLAANTSRQQSVAGNADE